MSHSGIRIKQLRVQKGVSQDELAEKLSMNRVNISHYERGKITNIPGDVLTKIAQVLNTNTDYLLGLSNIEDEELDEDFRTIQRAAKNLSPKDRKKMLDIMKITFDKAFDDDDDDDDDL